MTQKFDEAFWNERYGNQGNIWSGKPNPQLVAEVSSLPPGTALDVGCGEGADAIWLAKRGWRVVAVDISSVALARAAGHAAGLGPDGPIEWEHHDLLSWAPPAGSFDLVSAQFMQLPRTDREPLFDRLAAAVARGGTLLVVGHAPSDIDSGAHRPRRADVFYTAEEAASALDPVLWDVLLTESRARGSAGDGGRPATVHDEVMRAVRLP